MIMTIFNFQNFLSNVKNDIRYKLKQNKLLLKLYFSRKVDDFF